MRDLPDEIIARLKKRAQAKGRSVEAEHRAILEAAVNAPENDPAEIARGFLEELSGRHSTDSADLIRAQRDERTARLANL